MNVISIKKRARAPRLKFWGRGSARDFRRRVLERKERLDVHILRERDVVERLTLDSIYEVAGRRRSRPIYEPQDVGDAYRRVPVQFERFRRHFPAMKRRIKFKVWCVGVF